MKKLNTMKRGFSAMTAAVLMTCTSASLPMTSAALETFTYGDLYYYETEGGVCITDCNREITTVEIPAEIDGKPVIRISEIAFEYCFSLESITVSEDNTSFCSVDGVLFSKDMSVLVEYPRAKTGDSYAIPDTVTVLQNRCLSNTQLIEITIPEGITVISESAFEYDHNLKEVILPEGVTTIENNAFGFCYDLENIVIPDTVTTIEGWAFTYCTSLTEIEIPSSVTKFDSAPFQGCEGLTSVTLPDGLTETSYLMFTDCTNLTELHLPGTITEIDGKLLIDCTSVTDVYFDGLQSDWEAISIDEDNEILFTCTIHFSDGTTMRYSSGPVPAGIGDASGDAVVDANDAAIVLVDSAAIGAGLPTALTPEQIAASDVNGDGCYNAIDAALILQYGALSNTTTGLTFEEFLKEYA